MKRKGPRPPLLEALFTRQERMALAFLLAVGFLGLGVRVFQKGPASTPQRIESPHVVSVNRADIPELTALPGIGPVTARRIVEYRKQHSRFLTLADLKRVKGITSKTLAKLKGYVRFD